MVLNWSKNVTVKVQRKRFYFKIEWNIWEQFLNWLRLKDRILRKFLWKNLLENQAWRSSAVLIVVDFVKVFSSFDLFELEITLGRLVINYIGCLTTRLHPIFLNPARNYPWQNIAPIFMRQSLWKYCFKFTNIQINPLEP